LETIFKKTGDQNKTESTFSDTPCVCRYQRGRYTITWTLVAFSLLFCWIRSANSVSSESVPHIYNWRFWQYGILRIFLQNFCWTILQWWEILLYKSLHHNFVKTRRILSILKFYEGKIPRNFQSPRNTIYKWYIKK